MSSPERRAEAGPLVVCAGIAVIDNVYRVDRFPAGGDKIRASDFVQVIGGSAANAAITVKRLGGRTRIAAPLGGPPQRDLTGDSLVALFAAHGIEASHCVRVDGAASSLSTILIDCDGERLVVNYRDAKLDAARLADPDGIVAGADALMIDNRFPDFVLPIARAARRKGILVLLDGDRPMRPTDELLTIPTHIVFSADALRGSVEAQNTEAALHAIVKHTSAVVGATAGSGDILWLSDGAVQRMPTFRVAAVDTLAAGDVFHGALALALAENKSLREAMRFATATAALKCTRFGGGAVTPTRAEVEKFLQEADFAT